MSHLTRVGVLRGGPSNEYTVSLDTGAAVLDALRKKHPERYRPVDIFIDRDGSWHIDGVALLPQDALGRVDVIFNALHGTYGEDGKVQSFLEAHGMPFTGSGSMASSIGMNKALSKKAFKDHGIKTPYHREISRAEISGDPGTLIQNLFQTVMLPAVVKPSSSGSSMGVSIVRTYPAFLAALVEAARHSDSVLIEEYIPGIEATCGVIEGFRGEKLYALPPIEIRPNAQAGFFSFDAKYSGHSEEIVPATFADKTKQAIEALARKVHHALGLRHYSRTDFIIHPRRGIYILETNTLPGLTEGSLIPKALRAVGSDTHEFVAHVIEVAMGK